MLNSLNSVSKATKTKIIKQVRIFRQALRKSSSCKTTKSTSIISANKLQVRVPSLNYDSSTKSSTTAISFASMEISNQLEQVFKFIDSNGDGKISPTELRELLLCLGHDKSDVEEEVQGMVEEMDVNGDGFVDLNEYMNIVNMKMEGGGSDGKLDHQVHEDESDDDNRCNIDEDEIIRDAFLVFDSDKNGLISAKELHLVMSRLGFDNCNLKQCNRMIKGVDKDGDGFVDFEEFRLMMMGLIF